MGRPIYYDEEKTVRVHARANSKLHANSDRRAIIQTLIDNGGVMTIGELDAHFGYSVRALVAALARSGWLDVE